MFSMIRKRFTVANVMLTLALVLVMSGGAFAAGKYIITSTKQIKPSVLTQLKGKNGKNGANGATGANGINGKDGAPGPSGEKGAEGKEGVEGKEGKEGREGKEGKEGSPWTLNGTLPSGKTEKGTWAILSPATEGSQPFGYTFSFPIPLGAKIEPTNVVLLNFFFPPTKAQEEECPGGIGKPEATPGHFCVFARSTVNATLGGLKNMQTGEANEVGETGALIEFTSNEAGKVEATGTWAVTEK